MHLLSDTELLIVDMTKQPTLTRLKLAPDYDAYKVVGQYDAPGNLSPTSAEVIGDQLLLTESQISDVLIGGQPEHLPYRITVHPLSLVGGRGEQAARESGMTMETRRVVVADGQDGPASS